MIRPELDRDARPVGGAAATAGYYTGFSESQLPRFFKSLRKTQDVRAERRGVRGSP